MSERNGKSRMGVPIFCAAVLIIFTAILIVPTSREVFGQLSAAHPFLMGFAKFAFLATVGELIAARLGRKAWILPPFILWRAIIWGFLGMFIALAFKIFGIGVAGILETGILPGGTGVFWKAFMTSFWCNLIFAPVMMGLHKLTDTYLDLKAEGMPVIKRKDVVQRVNWQMFVSFTLCKAIPFFWIPAHTITFMLPPQYQIVMAAYLSIALGIILNLKKK